MARPRSADHDIKRRAILAQSAGLFAKNGFDRTSMAEVAAACGVSKALLYHYYVGKETLLFDILREHLQALIDAVNAVDRSLEPRVRLRGLVGALLEAYRDADHEHKIQINEMSKLPEDRHEALVGMERELVAVFAEAIADALPAIARSKELLKPVTMSLFGMLNWHYMWFREQGVMSREAYADLATTVLLEGAQALTVPAQTKTKRRA
ncbi:TetR/AcrR family transcriptional regulator [Pseudorhodoplanes sinuspersici]|uniref:TetR family transcriptional regulator n=1 Tax=Pseudorhodoplanes sinuspersici TaxID=1235591 RepID=A0A1W6ZTH9_9HYPH|nr:TetR/AcrR family transcriptional regulator [Pseudorhodoplanes sinuspersici]ARQ00652.1 TetR family transcriptional regulator [Pseudorhodoplanes sinuspersici]RKE72256.1 TetR family transcriptional regulator [Pseudorhodoplanes sinuspersici]